MANHQNAATLGVALSLETGNFVAEAQKAAYETQKLKNTIAREMKAADKEIQALKYATEDYGKAVTKVDQIERQLESGRLKNIKGSDKAKELLAQAAAYDKIAASQKKITGELTQQQKMALTYQTTDLFTQIASGQNPMIAIIQQGGQLKDAMGGIRGMFQAIGTLLTPFNVLMGATVGYFGALAFAAYKGNDELDKFNDTLTLTGGYADITATQWIKMSNDIAQATHTSISDAKDAIQALVDTGKFTKDSLSAVSTAVMTYASITGKSGADAAKALASGLSGAAGEAKSLNDKMNFLTLEQYKHIEALEKAGKKQEAARETAIALTTHLELQRRALGPLETAWKDVTNAVDGYWNKTKEALAGPTIEQNIEALGKQIQQMADLAEKNKGGLFSGGYERSIQAMKEQREGLLEIMRLRARATSAKDVGTAKDEISDYDKAGGLEKAKQIAAATEKAKAEIKYTQALATANEVEKIELEAQKKKDEKVAEFSKRSEEEKRAFGGELARQMSAELLQIESEKNEKIRLIRRKEKIETAKAIVAEEQALRDMNDEYAKMVATNEWATREKTRTMELAKEELQLKNEIMFASEKEQKLAELKLKYDRERQEAASKAGSATILENLNKQEAIERFNIEMQASMKKTQQVFDTVFSSLSSAIDNFVKTGKLSFKDFARSVIQDMIAMELKLQAMTMLRAAFKMFSGYTVGGSAESNMPDNIDIGGGWSPRASGGSVTNNTPYLVGERGPELFVPSGSGTIIPNGQVGSSMGSSGPVFNGPYIASMSAIDTQSALQFLAKNKQAVWSANQSAQRSLPASR